MRHVMVISYHFPPMGGVGVQRTLKFVKYLPKFGWSPRILTGKSTPHGLVDHGLLKEVPSTVEITRTNAIGLSHCFPWRLRELLTRWLLVVDEQIGWYPFAVQAGAHILRENPEDMIYSSSAPYTSHLVARHLAQKFHIPWVADFRDPWAENSNLRFPTPWHKNTIEKLEQQVLQEASHVLVVSSPMKKSFCDRYPSIDPAKFSVLPNGFDGEDFFNVQPALRDPRRFTIVYTGSFYSKGRTSSSFLTAIEMALHTGIIPRERLSVRLIGNIGIASQASISELNLDGVVDAPGFLSHEQSIANLLAADVLLLIIGDAPDSQSVYTGKLFEYLAAGKPILCLANDGVAADLIRKARAGIIVPPNKPDQISRYLAEMYLQWQEGRLILEPDRQLIETFERRQLTQRLADIFNQVSGTKP